MDVYLAVGNDGQFRYLCKSLGCSDLAVDDRFVSNRQRVVNRTALREILVSLLSDVDGSELFQRLLKNGVPCAPIYTVKEALEMDHFRARKGMANLDGYQGIRSPVRMSRTPASVRERPPRIGEHTAELLTELGLGSSQIEKLIDEGIVKDSQERV